MTLLQQIDAGSLPGRQMRDVKELQLGDVVPREDAFLASNLLQELGAEASLVLGNALELALRSSTTMFAAANKSVPMRQ